jgi:hypothetical protein
VAERGGHAAGGSQSAMAPPWFCDELGAGDRCRGHLVYYPNVGSNEKLRLYFHLLSPYVFPCMRALFEHDF